MSEITKAWKAVVTVLAVAAIGWSTATFAGGPSLINYQGYLLDDLGQPVDGTVDLKFTIYTAPVGGDVLWAEAQNGTPVDDGVFHVILGSAVALAESVFDVTNVWLQTTVDGTVVEPRRQFLSTPFAMRAAVADVALSVGEADSDWEIDGDNVYHDTGTVGIGTSTPGSEPLDVAGDMETGGGAALFDGPTETVNMRGQSADWSVGVQNEASISETGFFIGTQSDGEELFHLERGGNLGLGTQTPAADLHVFEDTDPSAEVRLEKSGGSGLSLKANLSTVSIGSTTEDALRFLTSNTSRMHIGTDGRVGIGTISPQSEFDVNGGIEAETYEARQDLGEGATPVQGGLYRDNVIYAWAHVRSDGFIHDSFGVESVSWGGAGSANYEVVFERALTNGASVSVTPSSANDPLFAGATMPGSKDRATVRIWLPLPDSVVPSDRDFFIQVVGRP